jgi:predicted NBD/HSP70 family sugar kinase
MSKNFESIGIDIGGTKTELAYFVNGQIQRITNFPTPEYPSEFLVILRSKLDKLDLSRIKGFGVGAPGFWDHNRILRQSINLPNYIGQEIWQEFEVLTGLNVYLKSDVELAAMGEAVYAYENQFDSLLYLNLGTGFGGGFYKDGQIFTSNYSPCLRLDYMVQPEITDLEKSSVEEVLKSQMILSTSIINLALILSPQIISIGGGRANEENWQKFIQKAVNKASEYLSSILTYKIHILPSKLKNPALYGANELVLREVQS